VFVMSTVCGRPQGGRDQSHVDNGRGLKSRFSLNLNFGFFKHEFWKFHSMNCLRDVYFYFARRQQRIAKSFKARKMPQNNLAHQLTWHRRRAEKVSAAAPTNWRRRGRRRVLMWIFILERQQWVQAILNLVIYFDRVRIGLLKSRP